MVMNELQLNSLAFQCLKRLREWAQEKSNNARDTGEIDQSNLYHSYRHLFKLARNCVGVVELGDELLLRKRLEEAILTKEMHPDYRAIHEVNLKTTEELLALTMQEYRNMQREINRKEK